MLILWNLWNVVFIPVTIVTGLSGMTVIPDITDIGTTVGNSTRTTTASTTLSQIPTTANTTSVPPQLPDSTVELETGTPVEQPLCLLVDCPVPENDSIGVYDVGYENDCTPYLTVSCKEGYTFTEELYYCIDGGWFPLIDGALCKENCGPLNTPANTDVFNVADYSLVLDTDQVFPSGTEVIYQCVAGFTVESTDGKSSLSYSSCRNGEWMNDISIICHAVVTMACKDQQATVISLGVLCGLETLALLILILWSFSKFIRKRSKVPKPAKELNTYSTAQNVPRPPPPTSPRTPPPVTPRTPPPRRTDAATVVTTNSAAGYYSYADVTAPGNSNNNVAPKEETKGTDMNGETSLSPYLEIVN